MTEFPIKEGDWVVVKTPFMPSLGTVSKVTDKTVFYVDPAWPRSRPSRADKGNVIFSGSERIARELLKWIELSRKTQDTAVSEAAEAHRARLADFVAEAFRQQAEL